MTGLNTTSFCEGMEEHKEGVEEPLLAREFARNSHWVHIAFITYFTVAGGPIGLEVCVQAVGPLITLLGILIIPVFWSFPQALMTMEFSNMFPDNGGFVIWVRESLGPFWGWMNAYFSLYAGVFDLALYPVLGAGFVAQALMGYDIHLSFLETLGIKFLIVGSICLLNLGTFKNINVSSVVLGILALLPFIIQVIVSAPDMDPSNLRDGSEDKNWGLFISTLLWNFSGWDYLGCFAGEVVDPSHNYPKGILAAIVLIWVSYLIPIGAGASLSHDWSEWEEGHLIFIAQESFPWLGQMFLASALIGTIGSFNNMMATMARAVWRMSTYGMLPKILSGEAEGSDEGHSPVTAVLVKSILALGLACFSRFERIVEFDMFFSCLSLILEFVGFLYLKVTEPDRRRPFRVPGGILGAILVSIPKLCLITMNIYFTTKFCWIVSLPIVAFTAIVYIPWSRGQLTCLNGCVSGTEYAKLEVFP